MQKRKEKETEKNIENHQNKIIIVLFFNNRNNRKKKKDTEQPEKKIWKY